MWLICMVGNSYHNIPVVYIVVPVSVELFNHHHKHHQHYPCGVLKVPMHYGIHRTLFALEKTVLVNSVVVLLPLTAGRAAEDTEEALMP